MTIWSICRSKNSTLIPEIIEWESEFSVYNPISGETHQLDFFPGELLSLLIEQPYTLSQLSELMADMFNAEHSEKFNKEDSDDWEEKILHVLQQFEELELVEQQHIEQQ